MNAARRVARFLFRLLYRVRVAGLEHYEAAGSRVLIVANHTSFLDAALLSVFLSDRLTFAIDPRIARLWWVRPFLAFAEVLPVDPAMPWSTKALIDREASAAAARTPPTPSRSTEAATRMSQASPCRWTSRPRRAASDADPRSGWRPSWRLGSADGLARRRPGASVGLAKRLRREGRLLLQEQQGVAASPSGLIP
jgi:Acyltransferase